jgi:hypothetical protein
VLLESNWGIRLLPAPCPQKCDPDYQLLIKEHSYNISEAETNYYLGGLFMNQLSALASCEATVFIS